KSQHQIPNKYETRIPKDQNQMLFATFSWSLCRIWCLEFGISAQRPLVACENGLVAAGADADHANRTTDQFADPLNVLQRSARQVTHFARLGNIRHPARQRFVHWLHAAQVVD